MPEFGVRVRITQNGYPRTFETTVNANFQTDVRPIVESMYGQKGCVLMVWRK